jgi:integrase
LYLRGNTWWWKLREGGKEHPQPTRCTNKDDARAWVREHLKTLKKEGTKVALDRPKKVTVEVLLTTLRDHYKDQGKASAKTIGGYIKAWQATPFWKQDANELRYDDFKRQTRAWGGGVNDKGEPNDCNATINRRISLLRAAYRFARKTLGLTYLPEFPRLPEKSRLIDKFTRVEVEAICKNLTTDYGDVFRFAIATGIRKGQLVATTKAMVDTDNWSITWPTELCKKREPQRLALNRALVAIVRRRLALYPNQPLLFSHDGRPIRDMRYPLKKAFAAAGVPYGRRTGKVFHGSRRTSSTNFEESGVARSLGKSVTGHSTDSTYERYVIHELEAQRAALDQAAAYFAKQKGAKVLRFPKKGVA